MLRKILVGFALLLTMGACFVPINTDEPEPEPDHSPGVPTGDPRLRDCVEPYQLLEIHVSNPDVTPLQAPGRNLRITALGTDAEGEPVDWIDTVTGEVHQLVFETEYVSGTGPNTDLDPYRACIEYVPGSTLEFITYSVIMDNGREGDWLRMKVTEWDNPAVNLCLPYGDMGYSVAGEYIEDIVPLANSVTGLACIVPVDTGDPI